MNRRDFLSRSLKLTAAGLLVPSTLIEIPRGRSMVALNNYNYVELELWGDLVVKEMMKKIVELRPSYGPLLLFSEELEKVDLNE